MIRSYNHIKYFVDNNEEVKSKRHPYGLTWHKRQGIKHKANQLDEKQRHTRFDYYEYDMPKSGTPSWAQSSLDSRTSGFNFQEHLEDPEHDQARHQTIHGHGRGETCYIKGDPGNFHSWH